MRLLVAEDEPKIGIYLQQGLNEAGFNVDRFTNGKEALQHALSKALDGLVNVEVLNAGLHLIGWLPPELDDRRVAESAWRRGLLPRPLSDFVVEGRFAPALMLGFSNLPDERIPAAVQALRLAILDN